MRSYADELVAAWRETYPQDELLVIGYPFVRAHAGVGTEVRVRDEGTRSRIWGQWVVSGLAARRWRADALVSVSSVVSPIFPRPRRVCTVHDWRHRVSPQEFSRGQRLYRRSWQWSLEHAGATVVISSKTYRETVRFAPRARARLIENGRDHARRWATSARSSRDAGDGPPLVLTFGHFPNKRPELVLDAVARTGRDVRLVVLGARDAYAAELKHRARTLGLDGVELPGFVAAEVYQDLVRAADVVVLASSDEGFGLPVAEAGYFGVPCVVTADSGLAEIHGDRVLEAGPDPDALAARISEALVGGRSAVAVPSDSTWAATVEGVRALCSTGR
ncbi:MAG: hypothetical protein JWN84_4111 [Nocardioides sp.]|nr:hypothetical protein [Nocardioides sp.]